MQTVSIFALVGATHCLLLGFICLLQSWPPKTSDKLLAAMLGLEGFRLLALVAFAEGEPGNLWPYVQIFRILLGPLFYFYTLSLVGRRIPSYREMLWHGVPFLVMLVFVLGNRWSGFAIARENMSYIDGLVNAAVFIAYGSLSWWAISGYRSQLVQNYSAIEHINLRWLQYVCFYFFALGGVLLLAVVYLWLRPGQYSLSGTLVFSTISTMAFCYVISLKGLQQSRVYAELLAESALSRAGCEGGFPIPTMSYEKYQASSMSKAEAEHFYQIVVETVERDKLYLHHRLRLADLAQATGLHPQQVSQVINQCANVHFSDFINRYRVEEALSLLRGEPKHKASVLDIADQAGFNSPATFYKYFRKQTGKTPKRYLMQQET